MPKDVPTHIWPVTLDVQRQNHQILVLIFETKKCTIKNETLALQLNTQRYFNNYYAKDGTLTIHILCNQ